MNKNRMREAIALLEQYLQRVLTDDMVTAEDRGDTVYVFVHNHEEYVVNVDERSIVTLSGLEVFNDSEEEEDE